MAGLELFANQASTTVSSGGTTAPSPGTPESWTVASSTGFPAASSTASPVTFFRVTDPASSTEKMIVTNVSGTTWTVTRGAEGTTPVAHASGFTVQNVVTAASLGEFPQYGPAWKNVLAFGADPTGSADSSAAFNAAYAALPSGGGVIYAPAGTYKITSGISVNMTAAQTVTIAGDGASATLLNYYGSGDCIRLYSSVAFGSGGAKSFWSGIRDLTIDGTNGTGSPVGAHMGDYTFAQVRNVMIQNFTGTSSVGLHLENTVNWTEEGDYRLSVSNCTKGVLLDVSTGFNSFGYSSFDLTFFQSGAQSCFCVENGAFFYNGYLKIRGDVNGSSSSLTGNPAVIRVSGTAPGGPDVGGSPALSGVHTDVLIEANNLSGTATHLMSTLYLDAASFGFIVGCYGLLDFGQGPSSFTAASTSILVGNTGNLISFSGIVNGDATINPSGLLTWTSWGGGTVLNYMQSVTTFDGFFPTLQADNFHTVLDGSNSTVFFNYGGVGDGNTLAAPQLRRFLIQQPSSGGPYALTWPTNGSPTNASPTVIWPGGTPPVLQTAANATDVIEVITWDGATWYGHSLNPVGVPVAEQFMALTTTYTLTSTTALQKLFNASSTGALTVAASTSYFFECEFDLSSMATASGNFSFGFGGTATLTSIKYTAVSLKSNSLTTPAAGQVVGGSAAAAQPLVVNTSTTQQVGVSRVRGIIRVNAGGTIIPEVALGVATTAVVGTNSFFRLWPAGSNTAVSAGPWS